MFLDEHGAALNGGLDGLTEEQARRSLVASRTTLFGRVTHATLIEKVWFDEAVTGRSGAEIGIPATAAESFVLDDGDTLASVQRAHRVAGEASRRPTSSLGLDDTATGEARSLCVGSTSTSCESSPSTAGIPDILREQMLSP